MFLLSIETGDKRRLTSPPPKSIGDTDPAFSPDGRTLAFIRAAAFAVGDVHLLTLSGGLEAVGEVKRLTFDNLFDSHPAWTPDGREIIYPSGPATRTLWRIAASWPGKPRHLASFGEDVDQPALSRQGQRLAYSRRFSDSNIWRVQLAGIPGKVSPPVNFIHSTQLEFTPMFSPDGKRIAFSSRRTGQDEIWVCDSDGSHAVKLTSFNGPLTGAPCWSPDGRRLTVASIAEGQFKVFVVSASRIRSRRHFWASLNYVHHNPVLHGCVTHWQDWPWSSYSRKITAMLSDCTCPLQLSTLCGRSRSGSIEDHRSAGQDTPAKSASAPLPHRLDRA